MKISYQWLKELLPGLKATPRQMADRLTNAGLEVEALTDYAAKYRGIVVGEVLQKQKHPGADRLSLCQVSDGKATFAVVCGAPNVEQGKKYPFAMVGAVLVDGTEIKPATIRGEKSFGMLCSAKELDIADDASGLLLLADKAKTGHAFADHYGLNDTILEVAVTPNRGDCLSHWGVAREVAALFNTPFLIKKSSYKKSDYTIKSHVKVKVMDRAGCGRYCAQVISQVALGRSPAWLANRLQMLGIRPLNNVVDATNYVMMETGHPLHAFDSRFIRGGQLVVKKVGEETDFETIDHVKRKLLPGDLVIADADGPVALAGIMGGVGAEIRQDTTTVILEAARFDPSRIRKTSRRLGLQTDSSSRFERSVPACSVGDAMDRLVSLIMELAGGQATCDGYDIYHKPVKPLRLYLPEGEVGRILGISIPAAKIQKIFRLLHLQAKKVKTGWQVVVPEFRSDLTRPIDLVEEIIRIHGMDAIPSGLPMRGMKPFMQSRESRLEEGVRDFLVARGFMETIHYSFADPEDLVSWDYPGIPHTLSNPLSREFSVLRPGLLPSLIKYTAAQYRNYFHEKGIRIFELRSVYLPGGGEQKRLSLIFAGTGLEKNWKKEKWVSDFYWGKALLDALGQEAQLPDLVYKKADMPSHWHPAQTVVVTCGDQPLGYLGCLNPHILKKWELPDALYALDLDFGLLCQLWGGKKLQYCVLSSFPPVNRDLALIASQDCTYESLLQAIWSLAPQGLKQVSLFDIYTGAGVPAGKKSLALNLTYGSATRTLTDEEVNREHFALVAALQKKLGVSLRS